MNMAENTIAYKAGEHKGYEDTAFDGLSQSLEIISKKGIKVVINGGSLNPAGLAERIAALVWQSPQHAKSMKHLILTIGSVKRAWTTAQSSICLW